MGKDLESEKNEIDYIDVGPVITDKTTKNLTNISKTNMKLLCYLYEQIDRQKHMK